MIVIYFLFLILAMIRSFEEKTRLFEQVLYAFGMFVLTALIGIQLGGKGYQTSEFLNLRNFGFGFGGFLLFYSLMMIVVVIVKSLYAKTKYIKINKITGEVEIMSSWLWGAVLGTILWGSVMFFCSRVGSFAIFIVKIKNITLSRIVSIVFLIFILGVPIYLTATYTKWTQKFINLGPIKRRIVKVQTAGNYQSDSDIARDDNFGEK